MCKYIDGLLKYSFVLLSFIIFIICLIGGIYIDYIYKLDVTKSNIYIFLIAFLIVGIVLGITGIFHKKIRQSLKINSTLMIILISVIFLFIQILLMYSYYFRTGWDSFSVIEAADLLSENMKLESWINDYFSYYPNNLFITILFSKIILFCKNIGLAKFSYFIILVVQAMLNVLTGVLIFKTVSKLTCSIKISIFGYLFYIVLVGLSPWVSIPYSDSMALVFPILMFYIYINLENEKYNNIKIFCLISLAVLGYMLKPQTAIIFISILLISMLCIKNYSFSKKLKNIFIGFMSIFISYSVVNVLIDNENITLNRELEISYIHFVKMGLNNITDGGYLSEDVQKSMAFGTSIERKEENIQKIKERLEEYGWIGLLRHQTKKTIVNYNDGTFAWGLEGNFYLGVHEGEGKLKNWVISVYYESGSRYYIFKYITQGVWLVLLSFLPLNILIKREKMNNNIRVLFLSLIGLFIFESIFEARARYLYTYVPLFIVSAMLGLRELENRVKNNITIINLE